MSVMSVVSIFHVAAILSRSSVCQLYERATITRRCSRYWSCASHNTTLGFRMGRCVHTTMKGISTSRLYHWAHRGYTSSEAVPVPLSRVFPHASAILVAGSLYGYPTHQTRRVIFEIILLHSTWDQELQVRASVHAGVAIQVTGKVGTNDGWLSHSSLLEHTGLVDAYIAW